MPVMMRSLLIALAVVVIVVVGILAWAVSVNNQLVVAEQNVNEKWAQVQNVYQRRADLVPNLVETVKGFAAQERTVLEEVTRARASASSIQLTPQALGDPKALERFQAAQNQLSGALSRLLVTVERYPDLKSNANFLALQTQLEGTENRITVERRRFNEAVRDYNTRLRLSPGSRRPRERLRGAARGSRARAARGEARPIRARHGYPDGDRDLPLARGREPRGRHQPALPAVAARPEGARQRRAPRGLRRGPEAALRDRLRSRGGRARCRRRPDHPPDRRAEFQGAALRRRARGRGGRGLRPDRVGRAVVVCRVRASGRGLSASAAGERAGRRPLRAPLSRAHGGHDRRHRAPGRASAWRLLGRARRPVVRLRPRLLGRRRGRLGRWRGRRRLLGRRGRVGRRWRERRLVGPWRSAPGGRGGSSASRTSTRSAPRSRPPRRGHRPRSGCIWSAGCRAASSASPWTPSSGRGGSSRGSACT